MDLTRIEFLGLDRVMRRGAGRLVAENGGALFVRDDLGGAYFLACEDAAAGRELLERHIGADCGLLVVTDCELALETFARFGFTDRLECYQVAYLGEKPAPDPRLTVRAATDRDLAMLTENYKLIGPEELKKAIARRAVFIGYHNGEPVGFIGEHAEGSMGMLFVFPEQRRKGFGEALQRFLIADTMDRGLIPFGQVVKDNTASLALQEKLGMTRSEGLIVWMWK